MKSQGERDVQTVTIATTLGLIVMVMLVGVGVLLVLELLADPTNQAQQKIFVATLVAAVLVSGRYLLRHSQLSERTSVS